MTDCILDIVNYINNKIDRERRTLEFNNLYYLKNRSFGLYALEQCRDIVCSCEGDPIEALYFFLCKLQYWTDAARSIDVSYCFKEKVIAVNALIDDITKLYPYF